MGAIQLEFFKTQEQVEIESLRKELSLVRQSLDKVRRGTYARLGDLNKITADLIYRLTHIEKGVCKNELVIKKRGLYEALQSKGSICIRKRYKRSHLFTHHFKKVAGL